MSIAQSHEFAIYGTGGMSNLSYKFDKGKVGGAFDGGISGGFGMAYTYYIAEGNFGITAGVGFASYSGKATGETLSGEYDTPDDTGDNFRFSYSVTGYEEKQRMTLLTVPLMLQYRIPFDSRSSNSLVFGGGMKFGLPMSATTTTTMENVTTSGYYSYEDQTYTDLPQHGFVTEQSIADAKSDIDFGISKMLSLEVGLNFSLSEKTGLYAGLFLDYGLNSIKKNSDKYIVECQPSDPLRFIKYNSVLNTGMVDKINLTSVGIKVGVKFGR
jgi:hypothetical protein